MHRSDVRLVSSWILAHKQTGRAPGTRIGTGRFLYLSQATIRHPSHGSVAEFTRPHYLSGSGVCIPPVVVFALPNILTWRTQRDIRAMLTREGVRSVVLPPGVAHQAGVSFRDLEVLDEQPSARWPRPHHALVRSEGRYYLSGYDVQERNSYFFCEVSGEPKTIEQAYQNLKPESVKIAEAKGWKIKRQGDMFFIRVPRKQVPMTPQAKSRLHSSNHWATVRQADGLTYVTGVVRHQPAGRRADHRALSLGRGWWLCVQNAVPVVRPLLTYWATRDWLT